MALFKISKGLSANLPPLSSSKDGYCYYTTDDSKFYIDYLEDNNLKRKVLNAESALKLALAVNLITDLSSELPASFDGSEDISLGITGILPIEHGGTGASDLQKAQENLGISVTSDIKMHLAVNENNTLKIIYNEN